MKHSLLNGVAALAVAVPCCGFAQQATAPAPPAQAEVPRPDPDEAAGRVKQALQQAEGVRARDISVTVHGDTLVLTGLVDSQAQAGLAASTAQAAAQGSRISNQLEVRPPEERIEEQKQAKLVRDIEAALRADPRTANLGVAVSMDEAGVIGLHGLVPSRDSRTQAERVATQAAGMRRVRNHLSVPGEQ